MLRNVDMNEISDGRRYKAGDMVRIGCDGCKGGADCPLRKALNLYRDESKKRGA